MSNPNFPNRKSIRLKDYDYTTNGLYFITLCCFNRNCLFGEIQLEHNISQNDNTTQNRQIMILNDAGKIANDCWLEIPNHFPQVILHEYIIMPNHIHGIIELSSPPPAGANQHSPANKHQNNEFPNQCLSDDKQQNIDLNNNKIEHFVRANVDSPRQDDKQQNIDLNKNKIEHFVRANVDSPRRSPSMTIGSVIRGFKIGVTKWMRQNTNINEVWQRNYYDHIIRDNRAYNNISKYIINNPAKWNMDRFYNRMK